MGLQQEVPYPVEERRRLKVKEERRQHRRINRGVKGVSFPKSGRFVTDWRGVTAGKGKKLGVRLKTLERGDWIAPGLVR